MKAKTTLLCTIFTLLLGSIIGTVLAFCIEPQIIPPDTTKPLVEVIPALKTTPQQTTETEQFKPYAVPISINLQWYIVKQCEVKQIQPELVFALIWRESRYRNDVVGEQGEIGLMQVHPCNSAEVASVLNVTDLTEPYQNCKAGLYILNNALDMADGDYNRALMVYNLGLSGAQEQWQKGIYSTEFSRSVIHKMNELER